MKSEKRHMKYGFYGKKMRPLEFYMNIFLPIAFFISAISIAIGIINGINQLNIYAFIRECFFAVFSILAIVTVREIDTVGFGVNIFFLLYWMITRIALTLYACYYVTNILNKSLQEFDQMDNAFVNFGLSFVRGGAGIAVLIEIFKSLVYVLPALGFFIYLIIHRKVFTKSYKVFKKEYEKEFIEN